MIRLIGAGMGTPEGLTLSAQKALQEAEVRYGMSRIAEQFQVQQTTLSELASVLKEETRETAVLLSGDTGFYSAATYLQKALPEQQFILYPGISSVAAFAAKLNRSYEQVDLVSAHGREQHITADVSYHKEVFLLTGGRYKAHDLLKLLTDAGLGQVQVWVGEKLDSEQERIVSGTAATLAQEVFDDLSVLWILNPEAVDPGMPLTDEDLIRGKVPMTKEEIRWLVVSYLKLQKQEVVWDIGAGTGSVTLEMAGRVSRSQVYAVEYKEEAQHLIHENICHTGRHNVIVVPGRVEAVLQELPDPDAVFIGGSEGALEQVLTEVYTRNPKAKVVMTAATFETLEEARNLFGKLDRSVRIRQISVSRDRKLGRYTSMEPLNPIWILIGEEEKQ